MNLQGSPATPYIYDSRVSIDDIKQGLIWWYTMGDAKRKECGLEGREWATKNGFTSKGMCDSMIKSIETCMESWQPRQKFTLINTNREKIDYPNGVLI